MKSPDAVEFLSSPVMSKVDLGCDSATEQYAERVEDKKKKKNGCIADVGLVEPGEVLALLGPNGSGKSTLLAALAGLIVPDAGWVTVGERTLTRRSMAGERFAAGAATSSPATPAGVGGGQAVQIPPERRRVGLLGQDPLLFPHLSAEENVAFGERAQARARMKRRNAHGVPPAQRPATRATDAGRDAAIVGEGRAHTRPEAHRWLSAVGLAGYERRRPGQLSGGQQQRVAIARALAARPDVLLLDEPMAALDVQTAVMVRQLLREQLAAHSMTTILVTHDVVDALVLADRVAIIHDGHLVDVGPVARVLGRPSTAFSAALAGVNFVTGTVDGSGLRLPDGRLLRGAGPTTGPPLEPGSVAAAVFPPGAVQVQPLDATDVPDAPDAPDASVASGTSHESDRPNSWLATVAAIEPSAGGIRLRFGGPAEIVAELPARQLAESRLQPGQRVRLRVAPADVNIYAIPDNGATITSRLGAPTAS